MDWLICLKAIPPAHFCPVEHTVLLLPDDADRVWGRLHRFGHVVSVTSQTLASLLGTVHPHVWFLEETEPREWIDRGRSALDRTPPSARKPVLLWHGTRESLDGLRRLRKILETFARETPVVLTVLTGGKEMEERWGRLQVRQTPWSLKALAELASQARMGLVPARPTIADSYLKNGGRVRRLFAAGCPGIGDSRVEDVVEFSRSCRAPVAHTGEEWLATIRRLWKEPQQLDEIARLGHALVRDRYSTERTAAQWIWFFSNQSNRDILDPFPALSPQTPLRSDRGSLK